MQKLVTASEMRALDAQTIETMKIPGFILMENAGRGVTERVREILAESGGSHVLVFCGCGNNGGDGFVVARHLLQHDVDVTVALTGNPSKITGDALIHFGSLAPLGIPVQWIRNASDLESLPEADLIVDALLGTGITGEVTGRMADTIAWINAAHVTVVSVDLPSGLQADTGQFEGACVCADITVTLAEPKRGLVLSPGRDLAGTIDVVDIGIPGFLPERQAIHTHLILRKDAALRLPARASSGHKGDFGRVVIFAGSRGMTGAATLCSTAVLRAGAGLAVLGCATGLQGIFESKLTEVMTRPFSETETGSLASSTLSEAEDLLRWANVIALGPGLGTHAETAMFVRNLVEYTDHPLVLDADAINAYAGDADMIRSRDHLVLTPHPGELARLMDRSIVDMMKDPIEGARRIAGELHCTLVLKGAPTVIASPDGMAYVNSTGNDGMATAGAGDVLTGLIAGLLGQGLDETDAAICGVYLHGLSGDIAAGQSGPAMMAGDLLNCIGEAFVRTTRTES